MSNRRESVDRQLQLEASPERSNTAAVYVIPLIVLIVMALIAVAWSPIFALIIAVPAFILFLAYIGISRRADEKIKAPPGPSKTVESDEPKGIWGEPRP